MSPDKVPKTQASAWDYLHALKGTHHAVFHANEMTEGDSIDIRTVLSDDAKFNRRSDPSHDPQQVQQSQTLGNTVDLSQD